MEKVTTPPKPKKPRRKPTDSLQECARVPATGKNATPHRNIFNSGNSGIFTTPATVTSAEIAYAFFVRNPNPPRDMSMHVTTSFPNVSLSTQAK